MNPVKVSCKRITSPSLPDKCAIEQIATSMGRNGEGSYLTPREVLDKYPQLEEIHGMTEHTIGILLKHHVLWGRYETGKRFCLIKESSVIQFIKYLDNSLEQMKIMH